MGYVESNLLPNEQITYRARLHRIIYLFPSIVLVVADCGRCGGRHWSCSAGAAVD
jgi:hypothetical protein